MNSNSKNSFVIGCLFIVLCMGCISGCGVVPYPIPLIQGGGPGVGQQGGGCLGGGFQGGGQQGGGTQGGGQQGGGNTNTQPKELARISEISGNVWVIRNGIQLPGHLHMPIQYADEVRTEPGAIARIVFHGLGEIRLEPNANVQVQHGSISIFVKFGKVLFWAKGKLGFNTTYVAGDVIGTEYIIYVFDTNRLTIQVKEGAIEIRPKGGAKWGGRRPITAGNSASINGAEAPSIYRSIN